MLYLKLFLSAFLVIPEGTKPSKSSTPLVSKQSARWQVSKEFYQTESNYVDILSTILQVAVCVCTMCTILTPDNSFKLSYNCAGVCISVCVCMLALTWPVLSVGPSRESDSWPVREKMTCLTISLPVSLPFKIFFLLLSVLELPQFFLLHHSVFRSTILNIFPWLCCIFSSVLSFVLYWV